MYHSHHTSQHTASTMAAQHHLIAQSSNGSLFAVKSSNSSSVIRCYDGSVSNGSLKFTLRIPPPPGGTSSSFGGDQEANNNDPIRKLVFASSSASSSRYLCALREYTILVYDLERGVVSRTLNIRDDLTTGKKGRKSSVSGNDQSKAIVCDAALTDDDDQLCVLVLFPSSGEGGGKCRVYQYDLAANADSSSGLKRKIKVGSASATNGDQLPSFGVAVSSSSDKKGERLIAIRMNDGLRICSYHSGEKISKATIPSSEGGASISSLQLSACSRYLATATKNQIVVYKLGNDQDDEKKKSSLQIVSQFSCKDDSAISHVELVKKNNGLIVLAFQPMAATASLFSCDDGTSSSFDSSLPPQLPKAQLRCDQGGDSRNIALIHSALHSRRPQEEILVLFQNIASKGSNASLLMQSISYDDSTEGTVTVGAELSAEIANEANNKKKRKAASSVALAPGDQGNEASLAVDLTSKRARKEKEGEGSEEDDGDFQIDDEDGDEGGEQGQSIAERLALLSSAMAESDDEEEDEEEDEEDGKDAAASKKSKFKLKSATSETLTTLLAQALSSNDSVQLNIALQVTDRRLVEGTVRSLQSLDAERMQSGETASSAGYVSMLMGHLVRRMARRHSLVVPLGVWVKAILAATSRAATTSALHPNRNGVEEQIAKEARDIALKLGPLRNFLNERVECFPQLLRLEGRLALLSEQL